MSIYPNTTTGAGQPARTTPIPRASQITTGWTPRTTRFTTLLAAVLTTIILLTLTACGNNGDGTNDDTCVTAGAASAGGAAGADLGEMVDLDKIDHILAVTAGHQGSPAAGLPLAYTDAMATAITEGAAVNVMKISGSSPESASVDTARVIDAPTDKQAGEAMAAIVSGVNAYAACAPTTPGADPLAALSEAARISTPGTLVLVHAPMLSDSGLLNLAASPEALSVDPTEVVERLATAGGLPSFAQGTTVILSGLGAVAEPQPRLSAAQLNQLTDLWSAIITAAGARVEVLATPADPSAAGNPDAPAVDPVILPESAALTFACGVNAPVSLIEADGVRFSPETDKFTDPSAARAAITALAQSITGNSGGSQVEKVHVTGYTVEDDSGASRLQTLGASRAEAVKTTLVEAGVPAEVITTTGVGGRAAADYRADRDADGEIDDALATHNRRVEVTVTTSC